MVGIFFGYLVCLHKKNENIPTDLEKCNIEKSQHQADLLYYKNLTKKLVAENTELRKKLNDSN
jgi:hypothetical protein